jgi:myo-inositol-1(or 4)-monophosphatase
MGFDIATLNQLVIDTARQELIPRFQRTASNLKADGTLVTAADLAIQQRIGEVLARLHPAIPLLGEEMSSTEQQRVLNHSEQGFWCLDPLDGTANFVAGMPCFATSLAYIQGGQTRLGIIYDPLRDECFHAQIGQGAWLNQQPLKLNRPQTELADSVAMVDFKRLPDRLAAELATHPPYRSQRSIGSVALDWCWIAADRFQLYLHGGQRLWDYAAGRLIFAEAGGAFRLNDDIHHTTGLTQDLRPKVAKAAVAPRLFAAWDAWLAAHL